MATEGKASTQSTTSTASPRQAFYCQLGHISWDKQGTDVVNYLQTKPLPEKEAEDSTLVNFLLECASLKHCEAALEKIVESVLTLHATCVNEVGGADQDTPLHSAALKVNATVLEVLLEHSADPRGKNKLQKVPLHVAAAVGQLSIVQILLEADGDLAKAQDCDGATPLALACEAGHEAIVGEILSSCPESLIFKDYQGRDSLHIAVERGHYCVVEGLLGHLENKKRNGRKLQKKKRNDSPIVGRRTRQSKSPLDIAAFNGDEDMIRLLLAHGADPGAVSARGGTCLWEAACNNHPNCLRRLLKDGRSGESLNGRNKLGQTLLSRMCRGRKPDIVKLLLEHGADCAVQNSDGSTPISEAINNRDAAILTLLLDSVSFSKKPGAAGNFTHSDGKRSTVLHLACQRNFVDAVSLLLSHGVPSDCRDEAGRTALHEACLFGHYESLKVLLGGSFKNLINMTDLTCWTALHCASYSHRDDHNSVCQQCDTADTKVETNYKKIISTLIVHGAGIGCQTRNGDLPLHLAIQRGNDDRAAYLQNQMRLEKSSLSLRNNQGQTPLMCALEKKSYGLVKGILAELQTVAFPDSKTRDRLIAWLTDGEAHHPTLISIFAKEASRSLISKLGPGSECAAKFLLGSLTPAKTDGILAWAAAVGSVSLVWRILWISVRRTSTDLAALRRQIETARIIATEKKLFEYTSRFREEMAANTQDCNYAPEALARLGQNYSIITNILRNPPFFAVLEASASAFASASASSLHTASSSRPHEPSEPSEPCFSLYKATLVEVYNDSIRQATLPIHEMLYDRGPLFEIPTTQLGSQLYSLATSDAKIPPGVRWIHLPANNMQWMADLSGAIHMEAGLDFNNHAWITKTWTAIQSLDSRTDYMMPRCISLQANSKKMFCAAIYLPYIAPAWHANASDSFSTDYDNLDHRYGGSELPLHGTRSLHEFYYNSLYNTNEYQFDISERSLRQVLTRPVHDNLEERTSSLLVNVDQLWIWILDETTLLTSSTHRRDSQPDPILAAAMDSFNSVTQQKPRNAFELAGLLATLCSDLFSKGYQMGSGLCGDSDAQQTESQSHIRRQPSTQGSLHSWQQAGNGQVCVKDAFSAAVAQTISDGEKFYDRFVEREKSSVTFSRTQSKKLEAAASDRSQATTVLGRIYTIRGELSMLKIIAQHQITVLKDFRTTILDHYKSTDVALPDYLSGVCERRQLKQIEDLDDDAKRIESMINTALTSEQNAASLRHAQTSLEHERAILMLTFITILFLPLSSFATIFGVEKLHSGGLLIPTYAMSFFISIIAMLAAFPTQILLFIKGCMAVLRKAIAAATRLLREALDGRRPPAGGEVSSSQQRRMSV